MAGSCPLLSWLVLGTSNLLIPSHSGPRKPHLSLALRRIDPLPERGREGVSEVGESRDQKKAEVSLVGWGMEVQRALPTLAWRWPLDLGGLSGSLSWGLDS